ncbi:MAG: hypothetical protein K2Y23_08485 [Cyanobacteria bacterium]|nr:hypothetical protein [Cyanobacteriota bacterium]
MMAPAPPVWADTWLRLLLPARDRETVSGDLMEEYRENIRPQKSQLAADAWYIGQVARFAWRQGLSALALAAIYESRLLLDWFVPTTNFAPRSEVTTLLMISTLLVIGAASTMRARSFTAGVASTAAAVIGSAIICTVATGFIYANWRSAEVLAAINGSGGLREAFTLPIMLIVPGTIIGALGALVASLSHSQNRSTD